MRCIQRDLSLERPYAGLGVRARDSAVLRHPSGRLPWLIVAIASMILSGCLSSTDGPSEPSLQGIVLDGNGQPVGDVGISITGSDHGTQTGADGRFVFVDVPRTTLDFTVQADGMSAYRVDPLEGGQQNEMTIQLNNDGEVESVQLLRLGSSSSHAEAIHRLVRPDAAPDPDARGKVEIESHSDGEEKFEVEIHKMDHDVIFEVFLALPSDPNTLEKIGEIEGSEGKLRFKTDDGGDLPHGVMSLDDLYSLAVEVRDSQGQVYLVGTVPPELPAMGDKGKGESHLTPVSPVDPEAEAEVEIYSNPRKHDERFEVEIEHVESSMSYEVWIECEGDVGKAGAETRIAAFTLLGTIVTDDDGEGKLRFKNKKGDMLPCDVEYVEELQGVPVRVLQNDVLVFEGTVPSFGDDDDD
ncbi:MAG: carboxypeptidase-like regulatory domain-containing protein [Candidatus Krumholzibacteriia bacterium]